jgi:hypothetical protein
MAASHPEVAVERERSGATERQGSLVSALAEDQSDLYVEVVVDHPQPRRSRHGERRYRVGR